MASNLQILYPEIGFTASAITSSETVAADHPVENTAFGARGLRFRTDSTASSVTINYDLGSGNTNQGRYLLISRADLLQTSGLDTVRLSYSNDDVSYTTHIEDTSFDSATLKGPRSQDYLNKTGNFGSSHNPVRYFEVDLETPTVSKFACSKIVFGNVFDFNVEVDSFRYERKASRTSELITTSGKKYFNRVIDPLYELVIVWRGVSDSKLDDFQDKIAKYKHRLPIWLLTQTNHEILDNHELLNVRISKISISKIETDFASVEIAFKEEVG